MTPDRILAVLAQSRHVGDAARTLGVSERTLYNRCAEHGLGSPGKLLFGMQRPAVEPPRYTGAPPPDFDDVAETHRVDVRPTDPAPAEPFREERILFIPDTHFPYEDKRAWQLMLRVGRFFQPHRIEVLGDLADFYSVSFHDKSPTRASRLVDEIAEVARGLTDLESLGAERRHVNFGNHENRLNRTVAKMAPALHGMPGLTIEECLELEARGWTHSKYMEEHHIGNLAVCHDWGKCGVGALKSVLDTLSRDVVQGHTHRMQTVYGVSRTTGETIRGDSFGWLGSFSELDYCSRPMAAAWWSHGCGVGWTQPDGSVRREGVRFIGGVAKIEGQAA